MKHTQRILTLVLLGSVLFFSPKLSADTITLVADEWCPYNCTPDSALPGFMVEVAQYAFEKSGHTVRYRQLPWSRAVAMTRKGNFHGVIGALRGDAPDFIFPKHELAITTNTFFVKQETTWAYSGIASLEQVTLGVILDYSYGDELDAYIEAHKDDDSFAVQLVSGINGLEINFRKILGGRVDAIIEDRMVMEYYLKQKKRGNAIKEAGEASSDPIFIAFSPNKAGSEEYAQMLSDAVQELRASGKLNDILAKYGLQDWK